MIIFATSSIDSIYDWYFKYKIWLDWHKKMFKDESIKFIFINDGELNGELNGELPIVNFNELNENIKSSIIYHPEKLGRLHYKGWTRSFFSSIDIAEILGENKILHIESDSFVISNKLVNHFKEIQNGWEVLWTKMYNFPENAIQIICKDSFNDFKIEANKFKNGLRTGIIENLMTYKTINTDFIGDRYGELNLPFSDKMDYYCQYLDGLKKK